MTAGYCSVDHLTYTYYTGEDESIIQGPNCYKCMNELFHAKDLGSVVLFYICTPTGIIPFTLHSLIFVNGSDSPFTMKTIPENIFKQNCVSCVQRTTKQMLSGMDYGMGFPDVSNILINYNLLSSSRANESNVASSPTQPLNRVNLKEYITSAEEELGNISKQSNKLQVQVIPVSERGEMNYDESVERCLQAPGHDHIANQAVLKTQPLLEKLPPAPTTCQERSQDIVRSDTISSSGTREECDRWHSLGHSETPRNLSKVCKAISHPRIPFVTKDHTRFDGMLFEKIFNYLSFLKHSELLDDGFSDYLFYIYPKMKNIRRCSLCNVSISCNQHADRYLDHFLSSKHIAKAVEKQWQLTSDYTVFLRVLHSYLDKSGRTAEKSSLKAMLKEAASKKIFSCEREEYNHLYKKRA